MKLRIYVQAAVYCTVVLGASLANAADVNFSNEEQRFRELEKRINSLETAKFDAVSYTGNVEYNGNSGQGCASCGSNVGCKTGCVADSCWVRPCPTSQVDVELLLFAVSDSEAEVRDTQNDLQAGIRLTYSRVSERGKIFRIRYFNFGSTLEGGFNRYEMNEIDTEIGRRFTLAGGLQGEFTAGIRFAAFTERQNLDYDSSFGPLVGVQFRGRKFFGGTSYVSLRHSWQFGDASNNGGPDARGTFSISEAQLGLEWNRSSRYGMLVVRAALEAQQWTGIQEADTEDIGLIGSALSVGLAY